MPRPPRKPDWPYGFRYPRSGTQAARHYWVSFEQINSFAAFILRMASHIEHLGPVIVDMKLTLAETDEQRQTIRAEQESWRGPLSELSAHAQFFNEVFLTRHIENYLSYLSALLYEIFQHRPETMRSSEKVDLDFVLEHRSYDSLVQGLAEKKVDSLSYSSFDKLSQFFQDQFHISICAATDLPLIRESIETRNISVHNRCRISRRYLEKVPDTKRELGRTRYLGIADIDALAPVLHKAVARLDRDARRHLRLPGIRFDVHEIQLDRYERGHARFRENLKKMMGPPSRPTQEREAPGA